MTVFNIPDPAAAILDRAAPVLLTVFPAAAQGFQARRDDARPGF